jgi:hypothetical protein
MAACSTVRRPRPLRCPPGPCSSRRFVADFHPEAIGLVLALLAAWAGLTGRPLAMAGLGLAALCAREDQVG